MATQRSLWQLRAFEEELVFIVSALSVSSVIFEVSKGSCTSRRRFPASSYRTWMAARRDELTAILAEHHIDLPAGARGEQP